MDKLVSELDKINALSTCGVTASQPDRVSDPNEEMYRITFENTGTATCIVEENGIISLVNAQFAAISGYAKTEIEGKKCWQDFTLPADRPRIEEYRRWRQVNFKKSPGQYEFRFLDRRGKIKEILATVVVLPGSNRTLVSLLDINESNQAFKLYKAILRTAMDGFLITDPAGQILDVNQALCRKLCYSRKEFLQMNIRDIEVLDGHEDLAQHIQQVMKQGWDRFETRLLCKNHTIIDIEASVNYLGVGGGRLCTFMRDITRRKHLEQEQRQYADTLSQLMSRLLTSQEDERRRVARELHDELGQSLMVLKLRLRSLSQKLSPTQLPLHQECEEMLEYINEVVENVRRISQDLSPSILENLGLAAALGNLLDQYKAYYQITGSWENLAGLNLALAPEAQINIYRIFQEIFTNIKKHSNASKITVNVDTNHDNITFMISDDGQGFELSKLMERPSRKKGLGLLSLDERVRILGGTLEIQSRVGSGTNIMFNIPLSSPAPAGRTSS